MFESDEEGKGRFLIRNVNTLRNCTCARVRRRSFFSFFTGLNKGVGIERISNSIYIGNK